MRLHVIVPTHTIFSIGVSISFERTAYTVSEDDLTLEVCLTLDGPLKSDSFVELSISLTSDSATGWSISYYTRCA